MCTESGIFFCQLGKCDSHLFLTGFRLRLNRNRDNRFREDHGFQDDRVRFITKRVTGRCEFQTYRSSDISGEDLFDLLPFVCMHLKDSSKTFFFVLSRIQYIGAGAGGSGVNAEECQFSDKRIGHDLECQCGERFLIGRMTNILLFGIDLYSFNCRNIYRCRHVLDDTVKQKLDTFVAVG